MKVIKGVLEEELENSLRMKEKYEDVLSNLSKGSLVEKEIKGHRYYYIVLREHGRVKFIYKGKLSKEEIEKYLEIKELRLKYKKLLSQVKKQIAFLERSLSGKEIRAVS
ncbi:MAG: hypothetical protein AB1422_11385 [bacterium]